MNVIKTKQEFQLMKNKIHQEIDNFLRKYSEFTKSVSPNYWRTSGSIFPVLNDLKQQLSYFEPLTIKDLEQKWVRDEVLTDEEKELYNNTKKYNL